MNPFADLVNDHARHRRMALARTKREKENLPLFAGEIPEVSPDVIRDEFRARSESFARHERKMERLAKRLRFLVSMRVDAGRLAELDEKRKIYPQSHAYSATHWRSELKKLLEAEALLESE